MKNNTDKKKKKKILPFIIIGIVVLIIVVNIIKGMVGGQAGIIVTTKDAGYGEISETINSSGYIESDVSKVYYAPANLSVGEIVAEKGDMVKKGECILKFDDESYRIAATENQLNIDIAEAGYGDKNQTNQEYNSDYNTYSAKAAALDNEINRYEVYIQTLKNQIEEEKSGIAKSYISDMEVYREENMRLQTKITDIQKSELTDEEKEDQIDRLNIEINNNELAISQLSAAQQMSSYSKASCDREALLEEAEKHLSDLNTEYAEAKAKRDAGESGRLSSYSQTAMEADKDLALLKLEKEKRELDEVAEGVVAEFDGVITDYKVSAGEIAAAGNPMFTLSSLENVSISIGVGKYEVTKIKEGLNAEIEAAGKKYSGKVTHINRMAEVAGEGSNSSGIEIRVGIEDASDIILGIDAKVSITVGESDHALIVPSEAVNTDKTGLFVYVVEDGKAVKKYVETGLSSVTEIEIVKGINEGDKVITVVAAGLTEGSKVTAIDDSIMNPKSEEGEE